MATIILTEPLSALILGERSKVGEGGPLKDKLEVVNFGRHFQKLSLKLWGCHTAGKLLPGP